ncbi:MULTISPECIES: spore coat protein U domain-containing protein [Chitinibacter]|uniref:spore coat protein U domain-containing protein n=1 Tax=Chitinibacter TaxID=230666 RepID=UPI00041FF922|nr:MULTISPECIES: spore coat protein U domain-containing protein [Chitinibacter]
MATRIYRLLATFLLCALSTFTQAAATSQLQLQITVLGSCSFVTGEDLVMDFGELGHGDRTLQSSVPVTCTSGTEFYVRLSDGLYPSGTQRQMAARNGNARLPYAITVSPSSGISQGSVIDLQLKATVLEADYATRPIGTYTDTVVLSVNP